jgi:murein DD-endopeptidase MepM/ murein hydrolase activator NlpD
VIAALALVVSLCWPPPVAAPISTPYRAPACRWCPGHEAIGFTVAAGTRVTAVAPGRVEFAGRVADVAYVTVDQPGGWRATYGGLRSLRVHTGQVVATGQVLAESTGALTFSLRDGDVHLDPTPFLGIPAGRPRLVPVDGHRPRPTSWGGSVCPARSAAR